jgi:hypothetical protein
MIEKIIHAMQVSIDADVRMVLNPAECQAWLIEIERLRDALQECKPIPVSERMPEEYKGVLVYDDISKRWYIGKLIVLSITEHRYQWTVDVGIYWHSESFSRVTHWMPLPPAPEVEP